MEWYEKFKVGQKVKVVKRIDKWNYRYSIGWNITGHMDKTIGGVYKIKSIDLAVGYELQTEDEVDYNYWYPVESLACVKGEQLLFSFMEG